MLHTHGAKNEEESDQAVEQQAADGPDAKPDDAPELPAGVPAKFVRPRLPAWARLPAIATGVVAVLLVVAYIHAEVRARERQNWNCTKRWGDAASSITDEDFAEADAAIHRARNECDPSRRAEIDELVTRLASKKEDVAAREARKAKAADAARERAAIESFPKDAPEIREVLTKATAALARRDLDAAVALVVQAQSSVDGYRGTSIEQSKEWGALQARTTELSAKVQPHLDKLAANIERALKQAQAEAAQDRRDGVMLTRQGFVAAGTLERLDKAAKYAAARDKEGLDLLVRQDPEVILLRDGIRVVPFDRAGPGDAYVHVRVRGTLVELWTTPDALRRP